MEIRMGVYSGGFEDAKLWNVLIRKSLQQNLSFTSYKFPSSAILNFVTHSGNHEVSKKL